MKVDFICKDICKGGNIMKRAAMAMAATILCIAFVLGAGDALMRYARPMNSFTYDLSLIWSGAVFGLFTES